MDLQELITRGRFLFAKAPERLAVFNQVNGKRSAQDIARNLKRLVENVHRDLTLLSNSELIRLRIDPKELLTRTKGLTVYEKSPLARTVPTHYFRTLSKFVKGQTERKLPTQRAHPKRPRALPVPTETEILDTCSDGEDQLFEFKSAGTDVRKITREIAAMLNTKQGGIVFYGVDDEGTIQGSDVSRQQLDQPLQNSVKHSISPAATITLKSVSVMGAEVLVVIVPPWNRKDVYQFDERVLIRKGTNVFGAKPEELRRLHKGEWVV